MKGLLLLILACVVVGGGSITEEVVVLLLDTSGSMQGHEDAMVEGVNGFLANATQTAESNGWTTPIRVEIYTFSALEGAPVRQLIAKGPLQEHPSITRAQYRCDGGTPLYDALGETLQTIRDNSTIILATDGEENASWRFSRPRISEMIEEAYKERDIQFIYLYKGREAFTGGEQLNFVGPQGLPGPAAQLVATAAHDASLGSTFVSVSATAGTTMFRHISPEHEKTDL